ncbi:MAG TPA: META domain-containing protein, partial [Chitinophagaceae bacterium]|nr:META domain-containing protein [Chitinophagaceae bacterium]
YMYQWDLTELNGKSVAANSGAKLLFLPGQIGGVTGSTGCNNLKGTMELATDHRIRFSPLAVTQKACIGANIEQEFLKSLEQAKLWSINNSQLELIDGAKVLAKFNGVKPSAPATLPEEFKGNWELEYITGPRIAFEGLYPDKKPTLIYEGGTEYKGNTSCNGMGGNLMVTATGVIFNPPITTMMACPGNGEQTFLKTFKEVDSYEIKDGKLILKSKGVEMMRFVRK